MKKNKKYWAVLLLIVVMLGVLFLWFQWRPARIKHVCSWVKVHEDEIPAYTGFSQEEADRAYQICLNKKNGEVTNEFTCMFEHRAVPAHPEVPAKDWWRPASAKEYDFCIHDKGL
jgi:hypothetical protein